MRRTAACLVMLLLGAAGAGATDGLPFLRTYLPRDYHGHPQVFAIVQDSRGLIYFGSEAAVFELDGVTFRKLPVGRAGVVRALAVDGDRLWVGSEGDFGELELQPDGSRVFRSRRNLLPDDGQKFTQVWKIAPTHQGVFICAREGVFRLPPTGPAQVFRPGRMSSLLAPIGDSVAVRASAGPVQVFDGRGFMAATWAVGLDEQRIVGVFDGEGGIKVVVGVKTLWQADDNGARVVIADLPAALGARRILTAMRLASGELAIGTDVGVVRVTALGQPLATIGRSSGLEDEVVISLAEDRQRGLWLGTEAGLARMELSSELTYFDRRTGFDGGVLTVLRHRGEVYVGTLKGLFRSSTGVQFERVAGIEEDTWTLLEVGGELLAGTSQGVYRVEASAARRLFETGWVSILVPAKGRTTSVWAGGGAGLRRLDRVGAEWQATEPVPLGVSEARGLIEEGDRLWVGTRANGLLEVDFVNARVTTHARDVGLGEGRAWPFPWRQGWAVTTDDGVFLKVAGEARFEPDPRIEGALGGKVKGASAVWLFAASTVGDLWVNQGNGVSRLVEKSRGNWSASVDPLLLAGAQSTVNCLVPESDGSMWICADALYHWRPSPAAASTGWPVVLRGIHDADAQALAIPPPGEPLRVAFARATLRFEFAYPDHRDPRRIEYQTQLEGYDDRPAPWSTAAYRDYTRVHEGQYRFVVRARSLDGVASEDTALTILVSPPWYRTIWAYAGALLVMVALIQVVSRLRQQRLLRRNRELEAIVAARTRELSERNHELDRANHELAARDIEKNEFLAIAAHDLKNPLGAVRGYAEMLREDAEDVDPKELVDVAGRIETASARMLELVTNLLDIGRIDQGGLDLALEAVDLAAIVRDTAEDYRERAAKKNIELIHEPGPAPVTVQADGFFLRQALDNIVSNAVKYSPPDRKIFVRVRVVAGRARAEVQDQGPGLTAADKARLFQRFARLSARPTAGEHSTGLGLSIVKSMIEKMNGTVVCESEPGQGATFALELATSSGSGDSP